MAYRSGGIWFWPFHDARTILSIASTPGVPGPDGRTLPGAHHQPLVLHHTAFAVAHLLNLRSPGSAVEGQLGEHFIARAQSLMGNLLERTSHTIEDIAGYALYGLYLLENNRRDAAYRYISNAMILSMSQGFHREVPEDREVGVRTFWTVYILDRWLSCVMGRSPTYSQDVIMLRQPKEFDGLPSSAGLRAHIELGKISEYIVCSSYRNSGLPNWTNATTCVETAIQRLQHWRCQLQNSPLDLPDPLTIVPVDLFPQASAFGHESERLPVLNGADAFGEDRACWALHMNYNQLIILAVRPAMLMAVHKAVASIFCTPQPFDLDAHQTTSPIDRIRDCSDAARCNLRLGRLMRLRSPRQKLLLPDLHNIFNAAIVLTMHQIIFVNLRTQDVDDVVWATQVFEDEAGTGSEYGRDCALVLRDLTYIASQLRNPIHNPDTKQDVQLQQRVFHDLLPEQETGLGMKVEHGEEYPTPALCLAESSGHGEQRVRYQSFNDIYKTLSGWWKEDPMQLYETFLS